MKELLTTVKKFMIKLLAGIATVLLSAMTLLVLYQVFTTVRLLLQKNWCATS